MVETSLLGIFEVGTLFGLRLLPCATQRKGDLANRRDLCLFKDHSSSQPSKHHKFVRTNDDTIEEEVRRTIEEEVLPWETLEVRLSNR
jgi:hypothetical protein